MLKLALALAFVAAHAVPAAAAAAPPAGMQECPGFTLSASMQAVDVFVEDAAALPCAEVEPLTRRALRTATYQSGAWLLGGGDAGCGIAPGERAATLSVRCRTATYSGATVRLRKLPGRRCAPTHYIEGVARRWVLRGVRCAARKRLMHSALGRTARTGPHAVTRADGLWCAGRGQFTSRWTCGAPDGRAGRFMIKGS